MNLVGHLPDGVILLVGAASTAAVSVVVAIVARRLFFSPGNEKLTDHAKLAEIVHNSLLAFAVFVLALVLSDVRANMGRAEDAVLREASTLARLDRELALIGGEAANVERQRLRDYAAGIVDLEWAELGKAEPGLSQDVAKTMTALLVGVRSVAATRPDAAGTLGGMLDKLDDLRQSRLESATRTVTPVFWWLVAVFLLGAMTLNGRHKLDGASVSLITLHMGAIGLVMAFIVVMDEPFRGESSIVPDPIIHALPPQASGG
jgi:hypothetical protein